MKKENRFIYFWFGFLVYCIIYFLLCGIKFQNGTNNNQEKPWKQHIPESKKKVVTGDKHHSYAILCWDWSRLRSPSGTSSGCIKEQKQENKNYQEKGGQSQKYQRWCWLKLNLYEKNPRATRSEFHNSVFQWYQLHSFNGKFGYFQKTQWNKWRSLYSNLWKSLLCI